MNMQINPLSFKNFLMTEKGNQVMVYRYREIEMIIAFFVFIFLYKTFHLIIH